MRKKNTYIICLLAIIFIGLVSCKNSHNEYSDDVVTVSSSEPETVLALFTFQSDTPNKLIDLFPHFTVELSDSVNLRFNDSLITEIADSIPIIVTIKTISDTQTGNKYRNPIEKLEAGYYDELIKHLCKKILCKRANVYIRFDPYMEVPVNYYPWQYMSGQKYIDAFRYFARLCKKNAPQAKMVWAPAGYPGTMEYYPGDDIVDAVTVTLQSDSEQFLDAYPKYKSVKYDLFRRLHRLRFIDKPIFVLGSNQIENDSVNNSMISAITDLINSEREVIYSAENFIRPRQTKQKRAKENVIIGFYDYYSLLVNEEPVSVEHIFVAFDNLRDGNFKKDFQKVIERGHDVIVTFEPFHLPDGEIDNNILQHLTEGKYNHDLDTLFSILMSTNKTIYLRFAHEMEIPITRYAWQSQNPVDYIHSFRYFMTYIKPWPENIKRVWGPAGDRGSIEWYPGNDVVDFMSIAIYGLPDKNITDPEKQESFSTIYYRKSWRLRFVDKPLFITEFGVKGPEEFQNQWLEDAARVIRKNPQIVGVNYFNMTDVPDAWGEIKPPDWSITKESFYHFIEVLNSDD